MDRVCVYLHVCVCLCVCMCVFVCVSKCVLLLIMAAAGGSLVVTHKLCAAQLRKVISA